MDNLNQYSQPSNPQKLIITEKDYPVTLLWAFKAPIIMFVLSAIAIIFGYFIPIFVILFPVLLIANPLIRANFHYSLEDKFLMVSSGVLSKKQRNLPYGVIQNVFLKQDLFDRVFKLASLRIENASYGGGASQGKGGKFLGMTVRRNNDYGRNAGVYETASASGNKINIPGLKKEHAEELKNLILQKIKENPLEDSQSGL